MDRKTPIDKSQEAAVIMEVAIVWLLCAAIFLELADRAPVLDFPDLDIEVVPLHVGSDRPENVTAEALSLKTATGDHASS